ncbi:MAG: single-stranded DNA-binding protein [Oscillospiraceae bacterium]
MEEQRIGNRILLCGTLAGRPFLSHMSRSSKFFAFPLRVLRLSGIEDKINVICDEKLLETIVPEGQSMLRVTGELRSHNNKSGVGNKLTIFVYATELAFCDDEPQNEIIISGTLCKAPNLRQTPLGREICDLLVAVNRSYGHSDYLPCISWGPHAREAAEWAVGDKIELEGRVQSRDYIKNVNGEQQSKTAFEVSANAIRRL